MFYYIKKFWKMSGIIIFMLFIDAGLSSYRSLALMESLEELVRGNFRGFLFWTLLNLLCVVLVQVFVAVEDILGKHVIRKMNNQVRRDMAATMLQMSHGEFHKRQTGEYLSEFTKDIDQIESLAWGPFFNWISMAFTVMHSIIALSCLHWSLTVASLASALIMSLAPKLFDKKMEAAGAACTREQAKAVSKLKDLLAGYDVLRVFGRNRRFLQGVSQCSDGIEGPAFRRLRTQTITGKVLAVAGILCQGGISIWIGFLSFQGVILQTALFGSGKLISAVADGLNALTDFRLSIASSKPYFEKITVHDNGSLEKADREMLPMRNGIAVEHLSFRYGEKTVLEDRNLRFEKGKKYALTGPSDCGKSTLLKLLLGWLPDYTGTIRFDGTDARDYTPEQLQRQMSYIEQDVFLFNTTIRENITLGEEFTDEQMERALGDSALTGDLAHMPEGLDTVVGEEGSNLSGGQKQRVAIARALIHDCSILLIDEGTSALDQKNADIVEQSLLSNPDLTLILISHHLTAERKKQFDRVYDLTPAHLSAL